MYHPDTIRKKVSLMADHFTNIGATIEGPHNRDWHKCDCCGHYFSPWNGNEVGTFFYYHWTQYLTFWNRWGTTSQFSSSSVCEECHDKIQIRANNLPATRMARAMKKSLKEFKKRLRFVH